MISLKLLLKRIENNISLSPWILSAIVLIMVTLLLERTFIPLYQASVNRESAQTQFAVDGLNNMVENLHVKAKDLAYTIGEDEVIKQKLSETSESRNSELVEVVIQITGLLGADYIELIDLNHQVIFSLPFYDDRAGESVKEWPLYKETRRDLDLSTVEEVNGQLYIVASKYIFYGGKHVGTLLVGIEIDEALVKSWSKNLTTHISLIVNGKNRFTSLSHNSNPVFLDVKKDRKIIEINNNSYLTRKMKVETVNKDIDVVFVVAKSMNIFFQSINEVMIAIGLYIIPLLIISMFFIFFIGRYIAKVSSSLKKLNDSLEKKNQELLKLDKMKDEFIANTSHELKTPLHGIIGLTESLINGVAGNLSQKAVANLKLINHSGQRLNGLVNDILDFSKLKHQNLSLSKGILDISTTIEIVVAFSEKTLKGKSLVIENNLPNDLPLVFADENRLQQILYNLIGNAIKFTQKGVISIGAKVDEQFVTIFIEDNGIGIAQDKLHSIFESFKQADGSISRQYGGTGLGLSISKQLVELHGGTLGVRSSIGNGSTFYFSIPIARDKELIAYEKEKNATAILTDSLSKNSENDLIGNSSGTMHVNYTKSGFSADNMPSEGKVTVLVVDDEFVNVEVVKNLLEIAGYRVISAYDGPSALDLISKSKPDVVLLDLMMPRMTGIEVCKKIRESYGKAELPVIMLTAKDREFELINSLEIGANDFLVKPCSKDVLLARLKTHLSLKDSLDKLESYNDNLESVIEERTSELSQYVRKIRTIMDTIPLGILIVGNHKGVHKEYSKHILEIVNADNLENQTINLLFDNSNLSEDGKNILNSCIDIFIGESSLNWTINKSLLPDEIIYKGNKILELTWSPIIEAGEIESLLLLVKDVTNQRKLEHSAQANKIEIEILSQLMKLTKEKFDQFKNIAMKYLNENRMMLESKKAFEPGLLFRNLHSLKGLSRYYGLSYLVECTHHAEKNFKKFLDTSELPQGTPELTLDLEEINEVMKKYTDMSTNMGTASKQGHSKYYRFYRKIEQWLNQGCKSDSFMELVIDAFERVDDLSIEDIFEDLNQMIESLAQELNCKTPEVHISENKVFFSGKDADVLERIFVQMIRNTISHAKEQDLKIYVNPKYVAGKAIIEYYDNGRGLNLKALRKIGLEKKMIGFSAADEDVANLIFTSGITTTKTVNRVSGRGLGMDIIKKELEKNGYRIKTRFVSTVDGEGYRSFIFEIECPERALKIA